MHGLRQRSNDVLVKRLAAGANFLGAIQHGNGFDRVRQRGEQVLGRKRPIESDINHAHSLVGQSIDRLHHGIRT